MFNGERHADAAGPNIRPYFFLSYARTAKWDPGNKENPDRWVCKLYKEAYSGHSVKVQTDYR
jgi:hypothetical protein